MFETTGHFKAKMMQSSGRVLLQIGSSVIAGVAVVAISTAYLSRSNETPTGSERVSVHPRVPMSAANLATHTSNPLQPLQSLPVFASPMTLADGRMGTLGTEIAHGAILSADISTVSVVSSTVAPTVASSPMPRKPTRAENGIVAHAAQRPSRIKLAELPLDIRPAVVQEPAQASWFDTPVALAKGTVTHVASASDALMAFVRLK